jgi:mono/diheme cytochrome c family protein
MKLDNTKKIEQYLANEMAEKDKLAFEQEIAKNPELKKEIEKQKLLQEGLKRSALRTQIQKVGKRYHFRKKLINTAVIIAIIASTALAIVLFKNNKLQTEAEPKSEIEANLINQLDENAPIDNLPTEYFEWKGQDSALLSKSGVLLSVPKNAFLLNGKPYNENAIIQWQEVKDGASIVKSGLSTTSNDRLLETQGMFGFQAFTKEGKKLEVNPKVGVYVQVPVDEYKEGMQLFTGKKNKKGIINWVNPEPLRKIPVAVPMSELDFYPVRYETELDVLKKPQTKKYRDSLYLSFDEINKKKVDSVIKTVSQKTKELIPNNGLSLFRQNCASCHQPHNNGTGPKLYNVRQKWENEGAKPGSIYLWVKNWQMAATKDPYALNIASLTPTAMTKFPELTKEDIDLIFDYVDSQKPLLENVQKENNYFIPPSKVLAFWQPKFDNTLLATREFERRMRAIHSTCDEKVLDLYTSNLSLSMQEIDEKVVKMGYNQFSDFVKEAVG